MSIEETYKKISQIEHILLRPDTYIGSMAAAEGPMWVLAGNEQLELRHISFIPGLYKIFDQILVNAADNYRRDPKMSKIEVNITSRTICILNDGKSIPVQIHKIHKIYVPQLIFGHLLTSSNYKDSQKKVTGGRNGFGAKLANIFSSSFEVEVGDSSTHKMMNISWNKNMFIMNQPIIKEFNGKDYTKISFIPDFSRFQTKEFSKDMIALLSKRVYDMAGILKVKVSLNGSVIRVRNFGDYVNLYFKESQLAFGEDEDDRWQVYAGLSDGQFQQISFVNAICTSSGGNHVSYIVDQITEKLQGIIMKKQKGLSIKPFQIKCNLRVFINCLIENPSFDSQTKETLTTPAGQFGSKYIVSENFIKLLTNTGIIDRIVSQARSKQNSKIDKQLRKVKSNRLIIPKLEDANLAGRASGCCLILTEGDSAKALAMCGIQQIGRDSFGVYPLKGKVVNVKDMTPKQVMDNVELANIVKIVGLSFGKIYTSLNDLRYSSVMIMADQDADGSHIKGLVINFFQSYWPSLCKLGFLKEFVTPIIKCTNPTGSLQFFSQTDYNKWKATSQGEWKIKYYKGLGTSTSTQGKQYFSDLHSHVISFLYEDSNDEEALELAFGKKKADMRKKWLEEYNVLINVDYKQKQLKIENFVNQELIHFSISDNIRSIPSLIDGLKPSQRKILFACFKRNLKHEIKVAQLAGYVAQHSAYHHGQASLCATLISMAQNYTGANNINLLEPIGQFGTRHMNGKDSASPRYIFTCLNPLTRLLFNEADDHIVEYIEEEGMEIEPKHYVPILPLILINGSEGIGTGWSTTVHPHRVETVIALVRARINGDKGEAKIGWEGFQGEVREERKDTWVAKGIFESEGETVRITEIPVSKSIRDYKTFLEEKMPSPQNQDPDIEDIKQYHSGNRVDFVISFFPEKMLAGGDLQKFLKLTCTYQQNNMHLFNSKAQIRRYDHVHDILQDFYVERMWGYRRRKEYLISRFQRENQLLEAKIRFIREVIEGKFSMMEKKQSWIKQLASHHYKRFNHLPKIQSTRLIEDETQQSMKDYNYLLSLPIWSFCEEKVQELTSTQHEVKTILSYYQETTQMQLWLKDIDQFEEQWLSAQRTKSNIRAKPISPDKPSKKSRKKYHQIEEMQSNSDKAALKSKGTKKQHTEDKPQAMNGIAQKRVKSISRKKTGDISQINPISPGIRLSASPSIPADIPLQISPPSKSISSIDYILSKYLKPSAGMESLNFEERIKARIAMGDSNYANSYNQAANEPENVDANNQQSDQDYIELE